MKHNYNHPCLCLECKKNRSEEAEALTWLQWHARPKARGKDAAHARVVLQMLGRVRAPAGGGQ